MKNSSQKLLFSSLHSNPSIQASIQEGYLTPEQLEECITNYRKFHTMLNHINNGAIHCIYEGFYEDALIKLREAERILSFAVGEGKNINEALIMTVLHNEACAFEGVYNLSELSRYLQTLLHHIHQSLQNTLTQQSIENTQCLNRSFSSREVLGDYVKMKCRYGLYLLQYSGMCSKKDEHQLAIRYAQESIRSVKRVCGLCSRYEKDQQKKYEKIWEADMLEELSNIKTKLRPQKYQRYLEAVRKLVKKGLLEEFQHKEVQLFLSEFTLHKILHLTPMTLQESQSLPNLDQECTPVAKLKKIFYLSAAYFTIGTELRLLSSCSRNSLIYSSNQFILSELYHLFSILLVLRWGRWKSVFLQHLLKSYSNHYGINLEKEEEQEFSAPMIQSIKIHEFKLQGNQSSSEQYALCSESEEQRSQDDTLLPRSSIKIDGESKTQRDKYQKRILYSQNGSFFEDFKYNEHLKTSPNILINKKMTPQKHSLRGMVNDVALIESHPFLFQKACAKPRRKSSISMKKNASFTEKKNSQNRYHKKKEKEGVYIHDLIGTKKKNQQRIKSKSKEQIPRIMLSNGKYTTSHRKEGKSQDKKESYILKNRKKNHENKQNVAINLNAYFLKEKTDYQPMMKNKSKQKKQNAEKKKVKRVGK